MGIVTALSATGLAAGLTFTGALTGGASAAPIQAAPLQAAPIAAPAAPAADVTLPPGGVLEKRVTTFCGRIPKLLERADKAQTRISGDAGTKGSLAWLKARQAKAETNQHPRVLKRVDRKIERRTQRLAKLPELKTRLAAAQKECATLDLPAASRTAVPTIAPGSSGS